jgi:alkanesulfonate monooxygenase SsuD/methylene tetrahydromethanopterin reductase-like flavin-dependent oxidoreductase (luciferase family)
MEVGSVQFDIFFSICQTPVEGNAPSEREMFLNFFDQVRLADQLGYGCAWVAETHLSCQIQKQNPGAVIPHFQGEIGLNTDILQIATRVFQMTKKISVGSAIRNIMCNGGPMAHAEAIKMFLSLHGLDLNEKRRLEIGFASGRFPFSNSPYGVRPRNDFEKKVWPALRGLVFQEATEIFLRFLRGDIFSSDEVRPKRLLRRHFRSELDWTAACKAYSSSLDSRSPVEREEYSEKYIEEYGDGIPVPAFWNFDKVGVIPFEPRLDLLGLTIGAHDAESQNYANEFMPVGVFNLSITPDSVIEETHARMSTEFGKCSQKENSKNVADTMRVEESGDSDSKKHHKAKGISRSWNRGLMPRTVLVFLGEKRQAQEMANKALANYWQAMEGTLDPKKVEQAVGNALVGTVDDIKAQVRERFHPDDRLMLWFDFNNHDNEHIKKMMTEFSEKVAPSFRNLKKSGDL